MMSRLVIHVSLKPGVSSNTRSAVSIRGTRIAIGSFVKD